MRVLPYLIYLFLVAFHVVILRDHTTLFTATLNLPALLVLMVALYKKDVAAAWFGFFVGLVAAAGGPPTQLGWHALAMAVLALAGGFVRERLNLDSMKAKLLLVLGGILVHNGFVLMVSRTDNLPFYIITYALGGAVYTTIVAWMFFMIKEKKITMQRIKEIF